MTVASRGERNPSGDPEFEQLPSQFTAGRFCDNAWDFSIAATGATCTIYWDSVKLQDRSSLTAPQNAALLLSAKRYLTLYAGGKAGRRPRAGTLLQAFSYLGAFIKWLSGRGVRDFSEVTMTHVFGYRNFVARRKSLMNRGKKRPTSTQKRLARDTQRKLLGVIYNLAKMQQDAKEHGTAFSWSEIAEIEELLRFGKMTSENATQRIPDDLFRLLMREAVRWISEEVPKILLVYEAHREFLKRRKSSQRASLRRKIREKAFSKLPEGQSISCGGKAIALRSITHNQLKRLITISRGAGFVVIDGLTGMRISEVLSLRDGCLKSECLHDGRSILRLSGTLYKTSRADRGEPAKWVAGWDESANPIASAVKVLEKLPRIAGSAGLFGAWYDSRGKSSRQSIDRVSRTQSRKILDVFVGTVSPGVKVAPHQFRKTFARFVVLSAGAPITALMRHFKHVSIFMTERYIPDDPELINDLIEASEELLAERLDSVFGAERLAGIAGQRIIANNEAYRGTAGADARKRLVEITLRDPAANIRLMPYGICIYDAVRARCEGEIEQVGLDVCIRCSNCAIHGENEGFWTELAGLLRSTIAEQHALGIVNLSLVRQLDDAERILADLSGEKRRTSTA